jgi:hypothetical protein
MGSSDLDRAAVPNTMRCAPWASGVRSTLKAAAKGGRSEVDEAEVEVEVEVDGGEGPRAATARAEARAAARYMPEGRMRRPWRWRWHWELRTEPRPGARVPGMAYCVFVSCWLWRSGYGRRREGKGREGGGWKWVRER